MKVTKLTDRQIELIGAIDKKMEPIQKELDTLNTEFQKAMKVIDGLKEKIRPIKKKLSPYGELKAAVASNDSKNKYFPEFLGRFDNKEKTEEFYKFVESKVNA